MLASIAIPGVFEEQHINQAIYSDGFLCENLGINQAMYENILAVDVLGKNSFERQMPNNFFKTSNVLEMFEKSMRILIYNQTKNILKHSLNFVIYLSQSMQMLGFLKTVEGIRITRWDQMNLLKNNLNLQPLTVLVF